MVLVILLPACRNAWLFLSVTSNKFVQKPCMFGDENNKPGFLKAPFQWSYYRCSHALCAHAHHLRDAGNLSMDELLCFSITGWQWSNPQIQCMNLFAFCLHFLYSSLYTSPYPFFPLVVIVLPLIFSVRFCSWLFVKVHLIFLRAIPNLPLHVSEEPCFFFLCSLLEVLEEALGV